jgi:secreted trypsin-like serine protease
MTRKQGLTTLLFCALSGTTVAQPSVQGDKEVVAAEAFARSLAKEGTSQYARLFHRALEEARDELGSEGQQPPVPGILDDERYAANLERMMGSGPKIWGGRRVAPGGYPQVVAVTGNGQLCSGIVIAPRVVLTAAHCHCQGITERVLLGEDSSHPSKSITVRKSRPMLSCGQSLDQGDVALLFLSEDAPVPPQPLAEAALVNDGFAVRLVGFGRTRNDLIEPPGLKRYVDVPIASARCAGQVKSGTSSVSDAAFYKCRAGTELVAGAPQLGRDSCEGDSGGPAFVKAADGVEYLAAITSRAVTRPMLRPCGDGGIYTRVDGEIRDWITKQGVSLATAPPPKPRPRPAAVEGLLARGPGGKAIFMPKDKPSEYVSLPGTKELSSHTLGLPVTAVIEETRGAPLARQLELEAVSDWQEQKVLSRKSFPRIHAAMDELKAIFRKVLAPGQHNAGDARALLQASEKAERELINAYSLTEGQRSSERDELLRQFSTLRRTTKAIYTRLDNYPPEGYRRIFENSRSTGALAVRGERLPFCSGFLIGTDLFLTAAHCLEVYQPDELEVRFEYELDLLGNAKKADAYPVLQAVPQHEKAFEPDGPELDFVLLKLGKNAQQLLAGETYPVQCLSSRRVLRDDALYIIGHPAGQPRVVHDNAFVYFPFQVVTRQEFTRLQMIINVEFADDPQKEARLAEFTKSYRERRLGNGDPVYENFSRLYEGQPTIGTDADTFEGDSGSPAYSRNTHWVIGMLFAGKADVPRPYTPGWKSHEAILPATVIIEKLDKALPDWRASPKVCVKP